MRMSASTQTTGPWLPYLAPMVAFGVFTTLEGYLPAAAYPWAYMVKLVAVVLCFAIWPAALRDLRQGSARPVLSVVVGVVVFGLWVGLEEWLAYPHLGQRIGFDPGTIDSDGLRLVFLGFRLTGLVLIVPVMEELFWRSFAWRFVIDQDDFTRVPIGTFSWAALGVTAALFALTHTEWLVAGLTAAIYGLWVVYTRSLLSVVIAHAVTNASLGFYVLRTESWKYW